MKLSLKGKKVILAVDPLVNTPNKLLQAKKLFLSWSKQDPILAVPVSLLTPEDLQMPLEIMAPWGEKLRGLTENSVKPFLKSLKLQNVTEPEVIISPSRKLCVKDLVKYAKAIRAEMIVTTTHDREGEDKNRIGQFTQRLIEESEIPVLTIRPNSEVPKKFSRILFPTDFSPSSEKAFLKAISLAQDLSSRIILYHNYNEPVLPAAEFTGVAVGQYEVLREYSEQLFQGTETRAKKWIDRAKKKKVVVEFRKERSNNSLGKSILDKSRSERADLIVLGIESHPFIRAILKSSTREVISVSKCPVLIVNTDLKEKSEKTKKR